MPEGGGPAIVLKHAIYAPEKNQKGLGIFWTVNEFSGERKKENLTQLNGFAIDIDGDKESAIKQIRRSLYPTWVIETKRGFHIYWLFKKPIETAYEPELEADYRATLTNKLIPFFNADKNAADICRLLRAPYFLHQKDPADPFLVFPKEVNNVTYSWEQIDRFFPDKTADKQWEETVRQAKKVLGFTKKTDSLFKKIDSINSQVALQRLSGHPACAGEQFTFKPTRSGKQNILVNGRSTSCWIDSLGKIGSHDKGGPTIWQWLFWYSHNHKQVFQTVKEVFPELLD